MVVQLTTAKTRTSGQDASVWSATRSLLHSSVIAHIASADEFGHSPRATAHRW